MVVEAAPGFELPATAKFKGAKAVDKTKCEEVVREAVDITVSAAQAISEETGINHGDLNPGNILFDDQVSFDQSFVHGLLTCDWFFRSQKGL